MFFVAPATLAGTPSLRNPGETVKAISGRAGCGLPGAPKPPRVSAPAAQLLLAGTCSRGIARHCAALRGNFVAAHCFPTHHFPAFPTISRHYLWGGGATEQVFKRRCLQIPSPSGLLPLRLTPTQPMLRKGNFYRA
ncbi:MAG: hypothetical protein OXB98_21865 [Bryobacterales bacterium]|nr:hypothetical protein [Bryobacterales bacterium]